MCFALSLFVEPFPIHCNVFVSTISLAMVELLNSVERANVLTLCTSQLMGVFVFHAAWLRSPWNMLLLLLKCFLEIWLNEWRLLKFSKGVGMQLSLIFENMIRVIMAATYVFEWV